MIGMIQIVDLEHCPQNMRGVCQKSERNDKVLQSNQAFNSLSMHCMHKTIVSFPTSLG
jgi:hypothetical protein